MEGSGVRMILIAVIILLIGFFMLTHSMTTLKKKVAQDKARTTQQQDFTDRHKTSDTGDTDTQRETPTHLSVEAIKRFDDVRFHDLSALNLQEQEELLPTLTFSTATRWPDADKLPSGAQPNKLLERAKNPGLGIRFLHLSGITGEGVTIGIIGSAEGILPGVLNDEDCGTAPGAETRLYAIPADQATASDYASALTRLLNENATKTPEDKLRIVCLLNTPYATGEDALDWENALRRAAEEDVLVLNDATVGVCYLDPLDPENVAACKPGFPGDLPTGVSERLLAPASPRTFTIDDPAWGAVQVYFGRGKSTFAMPYVAGVLALGREVQPRIASQDLWAWLVTTAHSTDRGEKIIDPQAFIKALQALPEKE